MPHGKAARRRNWQQASKAKVATRKAEKRASAAPKMQTQPRPLTIPTITEDDLLSFQLSHFGDDTKPDTFFVDPEHALNYNPEFEALGDDGLGWYSDGAKRTLTDEQIAMFRHTELEQLMRQRRLQAEDEGDDDDEGDSYEPPGPGMPIIHAPRPSSPISDASSLEAEFFTDVIARNPQTPKTTTRQRKKKKKKPRSNQSEKAPLSPRSRPRKTEVPYDQRYKRKWEAYIDNEDPIHGSMTHRRLVRELDGQQSDSVAIDYGDDEPAPPKPPQPAHHIPGRRIVSYEDD